MDLISCAQDLLCGTEFVPLRNDKIYGAFSLAAGSILQRVCFAGQVLGWPIKFKLRVQPNCGRPAKFKAGVRLNFRRCDYILKFADKILKREISLRKILSAIMGCYERGYAKLRKAKFRWAKFYRRDLKIYATKTYRLARAAVYRRSKFCLVKFSSRLE